MKGAVHHKRGGAASASVWREMLWVSGITISFWLFATFLRPIIGYHAVGIVFLMAVVISGMFLSRFSVFLIAGLLGIVHNFFFIPPLHTLTIGEPQDALMYLMFFLAAFSIGHLTTRLKQQNRVIEEREDRAVLLFNLAHAVSEANNIAEVVRAGVLTLERTFGPGVAVILYSSEGIPKVQEGSTLFPESGDLGVALWVRKQAKPAGRLTDTLSNADGTYFPLQSRKVVIGAVGLKVSAEAQMSADRLNLAQALVGQIAAGLEREALHESRKRLEVLEQADRLFRSLFDSVSHELKTPLTTIKGATSALITQSNTSTPEVVEDLANQIGGETERLLTVVDNMLDMTRLESGSLRPKFDTYDIADVLGPSLKRIEAIKKNRKIQTEIQSSVQPLRCDGPLAVQALANILHNSVLHTSESGSLEISATNGTGGMVEISIRDDGPGLPRENPGIVFDKFYREKAEKSGGVGLGLSIAKGFIEVQGGSLTAANDPKGGAVFTICLPAG